MAQRGEIERYPSPLRYPGGKGKVANFLKLLISHNSLKKVQYIEPYAGGASVALSLLFGGYVESVAINDLNDGVYAFWDLVLNDTKNLMRRVQSVELSVDEWRKQKDIYQSPAASQADLGFATFYLNRTNRSGIITRGGVIGGLEQTGTWKIDARFNRTTLCERIERIADRKSQITLTKKDAVDLLTGITTRSTRPLLYLDPPYYVKGAHLYDNFYGHSDHVRVREAVGKLRVNWVVSYDAAPEIVELYKQYPSILYTLGYSASTSMSGSEAMFFSRNLKIPDVPSPAGITEARVKQLQLSM